MASGPPTVSPFSQLPKDSPYAHSEDEDEGQDDNTPESQDQEEEGDDGEDDFVGIDSDFDKDDSHGEDEDDSLGEDDYEHVDPPTKETPSRVNGGNETAEPQVTPESKGWKQYGPTTPAKPPQTSGVASQSQGHNAPTSSSAEEPESNGSSSVTTDPEAAESDLAWSVYPPKPVEGVMTDITYLLK
jgi:hypothetical protein